MRIRLIRGYVTPMNAKKHRSPKRAGSGDWKFKCFIKLNTARPLPLGRHHVGCFATEPPISRNYLSSSVRADLLVYSGWRHPISKSFGGRIPNVSKEHRNSFQWKLAFKNVSQTFCASVLTLRRIWASARDSPLSSSNMKNCLYPCYYQAVITCRRPIPRPHKW